MSKRDTYRLYNAIKLKPLGSKMVVELDDQDEKTPSGLIVAHATNDGMTKGTVLAIGKGSYDEKGKFHPTTVLPGTQIIFNLASGEKFNHQDMDYVWLHEHEIMGVIT